MPLQPITSVEILREYLYAAIQLEHATIPTYLTTLYSIHPGTNLDAVQVLRVIAVEEMLHMTLSSNILNAVGDPVKRAVDLTQPGFVPSFPTRLPDGEVDFFVNLQRFSHSALETFLKIERPAYLKDEEREAKRFVKRPNPHGFFLPRVKSPAGDDLHYYSIGEFYRAIEEGLEHLCKELGEKNVFTGNPARQITPEYYYSGGGDINGVYDLQSAKKAITLISEQGEGYGKEIFDDEGEISHYYRFDQLNQGRYYKKGDEKGKPTGAELTVDWSAVYPIKTNAKISDFPQGSEVREMAVEFNNVYKQFLAELTVAFDGQPQLLLKAVGNMFRIKEQAAQLVRNPIPDGRGLNAAPTFEV